MQLLKSRKSYESDRVFYLPVTQVAPNRAQPRVDFDEGALLELADSIRRYGILQPLTVRRRAGGGFELVAGERRLRAARMAGLREVPCLVAAVSEEDSSLLALIENIQRRDLNYMEEAAALQKLIDLYGLSQEKVAEKLGKSQSAVANKLRLLKLPQDVLTALRENGLTERHGRALLRIRNPNRQREVLEYIVDNDLNVAAAESYIDALLSRPQEPEPPESPGHKRTFVLKDVRVFLNTLSRSIDLMKQGGINAGMQREETEDSLILTISIPKSRASVAAESPE